MLAVHNTRLLKCYAEFDPRVKPVIFAVKHWATRRGIKDASFGFLSTYSFVLLVIFFLQVGVSPPVLPHLQSQELIAAAEEEEERLKKRRPSRSADSNGTDSTDTAPPLSAVAPSMVLRASAGGFSCVFCNAVDFAREFMWKKHAGTRTPSTTAASGADVLLRAPNQMSVGELLGMILQLANMGHIVQLID